MERLPLSYNNLVVELVKKFSIYDDAQAWTTLKRGRGSKVYFELSGWRSSVRTTLKRGLNRLKTL